MFPKHDCNDTSRHCIICLFFVFFSFVCWCSLLQILSLFLQRLERRSLCWIIPFTKSKLSSYIVLSAANDLIMWSIVFCQPLSPRRIKLFEGKKKLSFQPLLQVQPYIIFCNYAKTSKNSSNMSFQSKTKQLSLTNSVNWLS